MGFSGSILSGGGVGGDIGGGMIISGGEAAAVAEVLPGSARLDPALGRSGSAEVTPISWSQNLIYVKSV